MGSHPSSRRSSRSSPWQKKEIEVATSAKLVKPGHVHGLVADLCMTLLSWAPWSQVSKEQDWCHSCVPGSLLQRMMFRPAGQRAEPLVALLLAEWGLQADLAHVIRGDAEQKRPSDFSSNRTIIAKCDTCHPACLLLKMPVFRDVNKHTMKRLQWDMLPCSTTKPCMKCDQPSHLVPVLVLRTGPHD